MSALLLRRSWAVLVLGVLGCCHAPSSSVPESRPSSAEVQPAGRDAGAATGTAATGTAATDTAASAAGAECQVDADCRLTPYPSQGCCRTSCTQRAIPSTLYETEARAREGCDASACVQVLCRPESAQVRAVCDAGHCAVHRDSRSRRD